MKTYIIFALSLIYFATSAQQKPLFSNYIFNEFYYNPAVATTKEHIDFRFLYRKQWAGLEGSPQTFNFSSYARLKKFPLGLGGNIYHDATGPLRNTGFNVAAAYGIKLKNDGMISAGIAAGLIRFDLNNTYSIREQGDVAVLAAQQGKFLPDASIGIHFMMKGFHAGFSIPQLFQSSIKLEVNDPLNMNKLIRHYFLSAGYKFKVGDKFELDPSAQLKAVKAAPMQVDINLRGIYNNTVWLGASYRTTDAISVMAGVIVKDLIEIGYAYDITTSNLNTVSNGSHEILLNYRLKRKDTKRN